MCNMHGFYPVVMIYYLESATGFWCSHRAASQNKSVALLSAAFFSYPARFQIKRKNTSAQYEIVRPWHACPVWTRENKSKRYKKKCLSILSALMNKASEYVFQEKGNNTSRQLQLHKVNCTLETCLLRASFFANYPCCFQNLLRPT